MILVLVMARALAAVIKVAVTDSKSATALETAAPAVSEDSAIVSKGSSAADIEAVAAIVAGLSQVVIAS